MADSYIRGESALPESPNVYRCSECAERVPHMKALQALNPFDDGDILFACPRCKEVNTLEAACVVDGCHDSTCMGIPNRGGFRYVRLCSNHSGWGVAKQASDKEQG